MSSDRALGHDGTCRAGDDLSWAARMLVQYHTMPRGEVGELMIRGPIVMQGYFGNEPATRSAIEPDGWLHSGDLGSMDEEGAIFIVDRKKDMINTAGFKVFQPRSSALWPSTRGSPWWR